MHSVWLRIGTNIRHQLLMILMTPWVLAAQSVPSGTPLKLVVAEGEILQIGLDSLHIDTLIMYDNSRIVFRAPKTVLFLENGFIGKNCIWDCGGQNGADGRSPKNALDTTSFFGLNGQNGRSLDVTVLFRSLGSLKINTSGGKGGSGVSGKVGIRSQDERTVPSNDISIGRGTDGSPGGNGGAGGSLSVLYACDGFLPVFNEKRTHSIALQTNGGAGGRGGNGGKGAITGPAKSQTGYSGVPGKDGLNGQQGKSGDDGKDGLLVLKRLN